MTYERPPRNPGSSEEFAAVHKQFFAEQAVRFSEQIGITEKAPLNRAASPEVIEKTNAQQPTPEA